MEFGNQGRSPRCPLNYDLWLTLLGLSGCLDSQRALKNCDSHCYEVQSAILVLRNLDALFILLTSKRVIIHE